MYKELHGPRDSEVKAGTACIFKGSPSFILFHNGSYSIIIKVGMGEFGDPGRGQEPQFPVGVKGSPKITPE